jgi:paraquat-inducible protein B
MIGHVTNVQLRFDPTNDAVLAPVQYDVEPERILGIGAKAVFKTTDEAAAALMKHGLRATLQTASLITGQQVVALEFVPDAPQVALAKEGDSFVLPTTDSGGISSLTTSAATLLDKVNSIPFEQIGKNLNGILASVNGLAGGPQMHQTLTDLSDMVAKANDFVRQLNSNTGPALRQLPALMTDLQKTLINVDKLFVSLNSGYGDDTKFSRDLGRLMVQLDEAVRSFRSLADMLTQHPEALIKGRPVGEPE